MMVGKEKGEGTFRDTLQRHGVELCRDQTCTLQVNVGLVCNHACRHCHLEAGPARHEAMDRKTMDQVIAAAKRFDFSTIDITGGAPELVEGIAHLVRSLSPLTPKLMLRCNLTSLMDPERRDFLALIEEVRPVLVASLPAANPSQTEALRGEGVWEKSIAALGELNAMGYGVKGSTLELNLVSNPPGAFLPPDQSQAQRRFRSDLSRKYGVSFTSLFTFANVPLGRFQTFLERSGNLEQYLQKLTQGFNPCTVSGLMCRSLLSVDWRGRLFDCDFNLAAGLSHRGEVTHIADLKELPPPGTSIPVGDHCFACTVGAGFT